MAARTVDEAIDRAVAACLKGTGVEADPLVKRRLALPVRFRGGGMRRKEHVRFAAYAGSLITAVPQFADMHAVCCFSPVVGWLRPWFL